MSFNRIRTKGINNNESVEGSSEETAYKVVISILSTDGQQVYLKRKTSVDERTVSQERTLKTWTTNRHQTDFIT